MPDVLPIVSNAATILAGALLLLAGVSKALHVRPAAAVLRGVLGGHHPAAMAYLLPALVGAQAALGLGLVAGAPARWLAPLGLALSLALTGTALVARLRGRIQDCGCYGALPWMTPRLAWMLDAVLLAALVVSVLGLPARPVPVPQIEGWGTGLGVVAVAGALVARRSLVRGPLIDPGPIKEGRRWKPRGTGVEGHGEVVVAFVTTGCPRCEAWVKVLRKRSALGGVPPVHLVSNGRSPAAGPLPTTVVPLERLMALVATVPTAVLVRDGVIIERWRDGLPESWIKPLR